MAKIETRHIIILVLIACVVALFSYFDVSGIPIFNSIDQEFIWIIGFLGLLYVVYDTYIG